MLISERMSELNWITGQLESKNLADGVEKEHQEKNIQTEKILYFPETSERNLQNKDINLND